MSYESHSVSEPFSSNPLWFKSKTKNLSCNDQIATQCRLTIDPHPHTHSSSSNAINVTTAMTSSTWMHSLSNQPASTLAQSLRCMAWEAPVTRSESCWSLSSCPRALFGTTCAGSSPPRAVYTLTLPRAVWLPGTTSTASSCSHQRTGRALISRRAVSTDSLSEK